MKYDYELVRSRRKNISLTVSNDNKITVRCPLSVPQSRIDAFLNEKSVWLEKIVRKNAKILAENAEITEYRKILVNGEKVTLFCGSDKNLISENAVQVKALKNLKKLYCDTFFSELKNKIKIISDLTSLTPNSVGVKNYSSRWGCCDGKNNVIFNYKTFMLAPDLQEYVIVHEICHVKHHNHSSAFWELVGRILPDYKRRRKELKNYDFLTRLY